MFCQHCGAEANAELNYCKRCGGNLGGVVLAAPRETRPVISTGTAFAVGGSMMLLVVVGLGLLLAFVSELRGGGLPPDVFKMLIVFGALTILGGVASLTWLWTYLLGAARQAHAAPQLKAPAPANELGPARINALPERPPASVVEHTTRTLEHARK